MTPLDLAPRPTDRQIRLAAELHRCDGQGLKRLVEAGLTWLDTNHQMVNTLNVFPIPDGDTGTNMLLTMQAAYKEVAQSADNHVGRVAHAVAHGALMGARGNSGVILSQIWRGFARGLEGCEDFGAEAFVGAIAAARDTAYRGVVKPVEGTILTVIKDCAAAAAAALDQRRDLRWTLEQVVAAAHDSVARTPELLPLLKQAGVVDSGGKGLAIVLEGMLRYLRGQPLDKSVEQAIQPLDLASMGAALQAVEPGQEWETVVDFRPRGELDLTHLYGRLEQIGTSIQVGEGDGLYRVHVHLLRSRRYEPIELAEELGTVVNVHMENLVDQVEGLQSPAAEEPLPLAQVSPGQIGVIAVSPGPGLARVMGSMGAAAIISGGQTKNPSTQDFLEAIDRLATDRIILLPNNKNILLAAQQAAELAAKPVAVVPSRTVPQGIAALLQLVPEGDLETVRAAMERALSSVESGEVATASRSVELNGIAVTVGQIIGLHNGSLKVAGDDTPGTVLSLLAHMGAAERELITLYHGSDLTTAQAADLAEAVRAAYPEQTVEVHPGGQPHYHYIISVE